MADMSRAEKLAAARKKLKEFQQKPKEPSFSSSRNKNVNRSNDLKNNGSYDASTSQNIMPASSEHREVNESPLLSSNSPFGNGALTENRPPKISNNNTSFTTNDTEYMKIPQAGPLAVTHQDANNFFDHLPTQPSDWLPSSVIRRLSSIDVDTLSQSSDQVVSLLEHEPEPSTNNKPEYFSSATVYDQMNTSNEQYAEDRHLHLTTTVDQFVTASREQSPVPYIPSVSESNEHLPSVTTYDPFVTAGRDQSPVQYKPSIDDPHVYAPVSLFNTNLPATNSTYADPFGDFTPEDNSNSAVGPFFHNHTGVAADHFNSAADPLKDVNVTGCDRSDPSDVLSKRPETPVLKQDVNSGARLTTEELQTNQDVNGGAILATETLLRSDNTSPRSTSENLRQLSMHVNGLIGAQEQAFRTGEASELECRNQELAALLEGERQRTEQLKMQLQEYQTQTSNLSNELTAAQSAAAAQSASETAAVRDQLQLRVQTIGILVAEKTELQAALASCQAAGRLKLAEAEELQERLKASRHRKSDLEKESASARLSAQQSESARVAAVARLESLQSEQRLLSGRLQELQDEKDETDHRLTSKMAECAGLAQRLHEAQAQLSLAQLRCEQLGSGNTHEATGLLEDMHQEKLRLEQRVAELELGAEALVAERDGTSRHYQQYVATLDAQLHSLAAKVDTAATENRRLAEREDSLVQHVAWLEKRLQDQTPRQPEAPAATDLETVVKDMSEEKAALTKLLEDRSAVADNAERTMIQQEARIEELEALLDHVRGDQPDQARLLATMESDKVAAARAVSQNQRLKRELLELQDGFIELSNAKLDLTDKLEHERHVGRETAQRLTEMQAEMDELRTHLTEHGGHGHSHEHQHEHNQISGILHRELAQSKERIEALSVQNIELKTLLAQRATADRPDRDKEDLIASLTENVQRLVMERDRLEERLAAAGSSGGGPATDPAAVARLQERFTSTMAEVAELSDEKQRLEHLVLQLQGETETIGEYITLYQKQRNLLRERAEEKDTQLKCLAQDREELRSKLARLNRLIQRLVAEKGSEEADDSVGGLTNGELAEIRRQASDLEADPGRGAEGADTADKIMALLTEIGTSSLVDPQKLCEHVYPCPCCSGRLITV